MKDELARTIMRKVVALRANMYYIDKQKKQLKDKYCKDTKMCVVTESLTFDDYKICLFDDETKYREQMLFEKKKYKVCTVKKHKISLNRGNYKRLVKPDGITTLVRRHLA